MTAKKPLPHWSKRKRITMVLISSTVIFLLAFILGAGAYHLGSSLGLIESQSIKKLVYQRIVQDPEFARAIEASLQQKPCLNPHAKISLYYDDLLLIPASTQSASLCLSFKVASNPQAIKPALKLRPLYADRDQSLEAVGHGISNLVVDTFDHPHYPSMILVGVKNGIDYKAYLVSQTKDTTWLVEFHPATKRESQAVDKAVRSITFLE